MTISVNDFPKIERLVLRRKYLMEFAAKLEATEWATLTVCGDNQLGAYGQPFLHFERGEHWDQIKKLAFLECQHQIAQVEIKIIASGVSLDA